MTMQVVLAIVFANTALSCHGRRLFGSSTHWQHAPHVDDEIPPKESATRVRRVSNVRLANLLLAVNAMHIMRNENLATLPRKTLRRRQLTMKEQTRTVKRRFPFFQQEVPEDQQPTVELAEARVQRFFDWADTDETLKKNLINLYIGLMLFVSLPVSYSTFHNLPGELPNLLVAANMGTFPVMLLFVLRLRIGWGYVSQRLRERVTYVEKQQRGFEIRKDRETSLRDRLIEKQEVSPIVRRLTLAMFILSASSVASVVAGESVVALQGDNGVYTPKTVMGDNALRFNKRLKEDNEFASEQQRRAQSRSNKPVYCDDRYSKIIAGGGNC